MKILPQECRYELSHANRPKSMSEHSIPLMATGSMKFIAIGMRI
jgi:hypothetical protein